MQYLKIQLLFLWCILFVGILFISNNILLTQIYFIQHNKYPNKPSSSMQTFSNISSPQPQSPLPPPTASSPVFSHSYSHCFAHHPHHAHPFAHSLPQMLVSPRKLEHINCIIGGNVESKGQGGLYIGDTISVVKSDVIANNKIRAILCLNAEAAAYLANYQKQGIETKFIAVEDHIHFPIYTFFQQAYDFIENNRSKGNNVLIQCHAGVSRSGTILCSYLMKKNKSKFDDVYQNVTKIRARIKPNIGFLEQLRKYEQQILMTAIKLAPTENKTNMISNEQLKKQTKNVEAQENDGKSCQKQKDQQTVKEKQEDAGIKTPRINKIRSFQHIDNKIIYSGKEDTENISKESSTNYSLEKKVQPQIVNGLYQTQSAVLQNIKNKMPKNSPKYVYYQNPFYSPLQQKQPHTLYPMSSHPSGPQTTAPPASTHHHGHVGALQPQPTIQFHNQKPQLKNTASKSPIKMMPIPMAQFSQTQQLPITGHLVQMRSMRHSSIDQEEPREHRNQSFGSAWGGSTKKKVSMRDNTGC